MEKFSPCKYINKVNFWFLSFAIKAENDINELYFDTRVPTLFLRFESVSETRFLL